MIYSFPTFIKFCQNDLNLKSDDDIWWIKNKPLPSSLIKKLFMEGSEYLNEYMSHLFSAIVVGFMDLEKGKCTDHFSKLPDEKHTNSNKIELLSAFDKVMQQKSFTEFIKITTKYAGSNYGEFNREKFLLALSHNGKKYNRLYYPDTIKHLIQKSFNQILKKLRINQGDLMGNVIADNLKVYRQGYSDAFQILFKKFLDFKFDNFREIDHAETLHGHISSLEIEEFGKIEYTEKIQGNLWQPKMINGGLINAEVDRNHPINDLEKKQFEHLILALSDAEQKTIELNDKKAIEEFRYRVSATLRKIIEIEKNTSS